MTVLTFQIEYHTTWGQQVCICGSIPELGQFDEANALVLSNDGNRWFTEIDITGYKDIQYYYIIRQGDGVIRREWGSPRKLHIPEDKKRFIIHDLWKNRSFHSYLYSSVFTKSIFRHNKTIVPAEYYSGSVLLNVICPYVKKDQKLCISGECEELGSWYPSKAKELDCIDNGEWQIILDADKLPRQTHYKFLIIDKNSGETVYWEDGGNRVLFASKAQYPDSVFAEMALQFHHHSFSYKGIGTSIPVFSIKTEDSFGIGDFTDLKKMIDWAALTHQQLIQLLPVNDTTTTKTWRDSYPYSAISIYALHPIYLGCREYKLKDVKKLNSYIEKAVKLNELPEIDYEKVLKLKLDFSRDLFLQDGEKVMASNEFSEFYDKNSEWLFPYSCYCYLRDKNKTANFREWGELSKYDGERLKRMIKTYPDAKKETDYYSFVQYLLHKQFSAVSLYAHEKGITLKGDIPIGIDRDSVDAWSSPHLFNMDTQTGAPPDDFSYFGQNWGLPTYNWKAMEEDHYKWWKSRFGKMADYFDAYRIDHILGFFRIWEIPLDAVQGLLGHFNPALPYWAEEISRAGIPFDEERMVKPFIHENFLTDIFGDYTEEVKSNYLDISGWQRFKLKSFCDTQRKIALLFDNKTDKKDKTICEGLLSLCAEVLFVRDPNDFSRFHPRITAQYTHSFLYLDDGVKSAFNRLYDDFYFNRHNYFWRDQAMKKLPPLISSTNMMVCGEDLGMVPDCVPSVMYELQILSLEIERMPKNSNYKFTDLNNLPYLSVCTTSTHDMSPIRLWWTENKEITQRYYNDVLKHEGKAPKECSPALCQQIIERHLRSAAMWVILPWQDWLSIDKKLRNPDIEAERINVPANPEHYWNYRMHIPMEKLLNETGLNNRIKSMCESVNA